MPGRTESGPAGRLPLPPFDVLIRFALVGIAATLSYLLASLALIALGLFPLLVGNAIAFALSILVSYLGHHRFTFRLAGRHDFHFPRFVVITALLFFLSNVILWVSVNWLELPATIGTVIVALFYPAASLILHHAWTFSTRRYAGLRAGGR